MDHGPQALWGPYLTRGKMKEGSWGLGRPGLMVKAPVSCKCFSDGPGTGCSGWAARGPEFGGASPALRQRERWKQGGTEPSASFYRGGNQSSERGRPHPTSHSKGLQSPASDPHLLPSMQGCPLAQEVSPAPSTPAADGGAPWEQSPPRVGCWPALQGKEAPPTPP